MFMLKCVSQWHDVPGSTIAYPYVHIRMHACMHTTQVVDAEVAKGVPLSKIVLGGFSMGGAQAIHTALGDKELANGMCVRTCDKMHRIRDFVLS